MRPCVVRRDRGTAPGGVFRSLVCRSTEAKSRDARRAWRIPCRGGTLRGPRLDTCRLSRSGRFSRHVLRLFGWRTAGFDRARAQGRLSDGTGVWSIDDRLLIRYVDRNCNEYQHEDSNRCIVEAVGSLARIRPRCTGKHIRCGRGYRFRGYRFHDLEAVFCRAAWRGFRSPLGIGNSDVALHSIAAESGVALKTCFSACLIDRPAPQAGREVQLRPAGVAKPRVRRVIVFTKRAMHSRDHRTCTLPGKRMRH
jgi:hypothetical protein